MQVANSYEKGVDDLVSGAVDFARFGPASYITARECNPDIRILAIESKKGRKEFNGVTCVAEDGPLQGMEDLQAVLLEMDAPRCLEGIEERRLSCRSGCRLRCDSHRHAAAEPAVFRIGRH